MDTVLPDLAELDAEALHSTAQYESASNLFRKLTNCDWGKITAWHIARWQSDFVRTVQLWVRKNNEKWAGRQLGAFACKPTLPILTPANRLNKARAVWEHVLRGMREKDLASAFNEREHLAERLRDATYLLTDIELGATKRELSWQLKGVLARDYRFKLPVWQQLPTPDEAGEILAKIDHFLQCWHTFHEALSNARVGNKLVAFVAAPPRPAATTSIPTTLASLTPADRILVAPFTLDEATHLAAQIGITDECGRYCLDTRKRGAVVGFCLALQHAKKLTGTIPDLTAFIGHHFGVKIKTRKTGTGVAVKYYELTNKALARLKKMD
jgi:hypothetical protein